MLNIAATLLTSHTYAVNLNCINFVTLKYLFEIDDIFKYWYDGIITIDSDLKIQQNLTATRRSIMDMQHVTQNAFLNNLSLLDAPSSVIMKITLTEAQ